jgi:hypothetical protein
MRGPLFGVYTYGTIRVSNKKYMQNNNIPWSVRASLAIQPIIITPFMFPVYIAQDIVFSEDKDE